MKIFLRLIFTISAAFIGLIIMLNVGGRFFVSKSDGLAGVGMVLGYGLLGAVVSLIVALIVSLKLSDKKLRNVTICVGTVALILLGLTLNNFQKMKNARLDPESAYAGLPAFTVTIQQTKIIDPVLSTRYTINTIDRKWTSTLPDGRICRGTLSAKAHKAISQPLLKLSEDGGAAIKSCREISQNSEKELNWKILTPVEGVQKGRIEVSQACLNDHPHMAHLIREVSKANLSTTSAVKCK